MNKYSCSLQRSINQRIQWYEIILKSIIWLIFFRKFPRMTIIRPRTIIRQTRVPCMQWPWTLQDLDAEKFYPGMSCTLVLWNRKGWGRHKPSTKLKSCLSKYKLVYDRWFRIEIELRCESIRFTVLDEYRGESLLNKVSYLGTVDSNFETRILQAYSNPSFGAYLN